MALLLNGVDGIITIGLLVGVESVVVAGITVASVPIPLRSGEEVEEGPDPSLILRIAES